jgi:16S rRNA (guanine(966)-N(2))-methyltransferase RsmD
MQNKKPAKTPVHRAPPPQQVRIIGGDWKRTPLPVLAALGLRPTPDRVRETVFNWINHLWHSYWADKRCLDLFAGTGALGFEAASRGAASVTLADTHVPVVRQLETVKDKLKASQVTVQRADALQLADSLARRGAQFDLVFLDPPYDAQLLERMLPLCKHLLAEDGLVYAEDSAPLPFGDDAPAWLSEWELVRSDKAGNVHYHLLRLERAAA